MHTKRWYRVDLMRAPSGATCLLQATQASAAPSYHVLQYRYVPDILEKRGPFREAHLGAARQKVAPHAPCQDMTIDSGWGLVRMHPYLEAATDAQFPCRRRRGKSCWPARSQSQLTALSSFGRMPHRRSAELHL